MFFVFFFYFLFRVYNVVTMKLLLDCRIARQEEQKIKKEKSRGLDEGISIGVVQHACGCADEQQHNYAVIVFRLHFHHGMENHDVCSTWSGVPIKSKRQMRRNMYGNSTSESYSNLKCKKRGAQRNGIYGAGVDGSEFCLPYTHSLLTINIWCNFIVWQATAVGNRAHPKIAEHKSNTTRKRHTCTHIYIYIFYIYRFQPLFSHGSWLPSVMCLNSIPFPTVALALLQFRCIKQLVHRWTIYAVKPVRLCGTRNEWDATTTDIQHTQWNEDENGYAHIWLTLVMYNTRIGPAKWLLLSCRDGGDRAGR